MDKLIDELCNKTGIDRSTAEKVADYLKANASRLPELVGGQGGAGEIASKIGGMVGR